MRLRWLWCGPLALLVCSGACQAPFNIVYNYSVAQGWPDPGGGGGHSGLETDSGYLVLGHQVATSGLTKCFAFEFDLTGQPIADLELLPSDPSNQNFGSIDPVHKDAVGIIGAISSFDNLNDSTSKVDIARISPQGDPLWQVSVLDSCLCGVKQLRLGDDGSALMAGYSGLNAMFLKSDTLGNVDTLRTYPNTYAALGVRPLVQGGYCLSGFQLNGVNDGLWVMRLDSIGNTVWRRNFGGSHHAYDNVSAIQTQDGGIVATGSYMPLPGSWNSPQWNYFRKWDINGNVQWSEQYNQAQGSTTYDIEELPSGELVASGAENSHWGLLMKLEADGDLLWLRRYEYYPTNGSIHALYDVEPTSDAGFVLTGRVLQGGFDSIPGLSMVWLLKVDSAGCLVPGCGNIGVEEVVLGLENALSVYPNPAHGTATITAALPGDLQVRGTLSLVLVDGLGRTVRNEQLGRTFSSTTLDLSGLPQGIYHVHLHDDTRWLSGAMVVVQ